MFSHDELICKMVAQPNSLDLSLLLVAAKDANTMVEDEEEIRKHIVNMVSKIVTLCVCVACFACLVMVHVL